jgi:pilus assembly protein Flp/PilA
MRSQQTRTEDGASAVEYGLMITGIAGVIVAAVFVFGGFVGGTFTHSCATVRDAVVAHGVGDAACS